jgi:hypothetical protein
MEEQLMAAEPSVGLREQEQFNEVTMGDYKRNEIINKSMDIERKNKEEYKRKLQKGLI